ncbi:ribonuclease HII [bacterium BMS3Abin01]|nr:ribonuclease HII [bacterium BMS3Abin01]
MSLSRTRSAASLFSFDLERGDGGEVAGADEAGRGCLAGPIVAAAVVFDCSLYGSRSFEPLVDRLDDSKRLSAGAREGLYPFIIRNAVRLSIVSAGNMTIDEDGLHRTNLRLLEASLLQLDPCPEHALVDGYALPGSLLEHQPVKKGDARSACIAAASVLAKVTRDRIMRSLHHQFPQYGFERHVGYATKAHRAAIARHGLCRLHRRSFSMGPLPGPEKAG